MNNTSDSPSEAVTEAPRAVQSRVGELVIEWAIATEEGATFGQALARVLGGAQPGKEARWINTVAAFFLLGLGIGLELFMFSR